MTDLIEILSAELAVFEDLKIASIQELDQVEVQNYLEIITSAEKEKRRELISLS